MVPLVRRAARSQPRRPTFQSGKRYLNTLGSFPRGHGTHGDHIARANRVPHEVETDKGVTRPAAMV